MVGIFAPIERTTFITSLIILFSPLIPNEHFYSKSADVRIYFINQLIIYYVKFINKDHFQGMLNPIGTFLIFE